MGDLQPRREHEINLTGLDAQHTQIFTSELSLIRATLETYTAQNIHGMQQTSEMIIAALQQLDTLAGRVDALVKQPGRSKEHQARVEGWAAGFQDLCAELYASATEAAAKKALERSVVSMTTVQRQQLTVVEATQERPALTSSAHHYTPRTKKKDEVDLSAYLMAVGVGLLIILVIYGAIIGISRLSQIEIPYVTDWYRTYKAENVGIRIPTDAELSTHVTETMPENGVIKAAFISTWHKRLASFSGEATIIQTPKDRILRGDYGVEQSPHVWALLSIKDEQGAVVNKGMLGFDVVNDEIVYTTFVSQRWVRDHPERYDPKYLAIFSTQELNQIYAFLQ